MADDDVAVVSVVAAAEKGAVVRSGGCGGRASAPTGDGSVAKAGSWAWPRRKKRQKTKAERSSEERPKKAERSPEERPEESEMSRNPNERPRETASDLRAGGGKEGED